MPGRTLLTLPAPVLPAPPQYTLRGFEKPVAVTVKNVTTTTGKGASKKTDTKQVKEFYSFNSGQNVALKWKVGTALTPQPLPATRRHAQLSACCQLVKLHDD